MDPEPVISLMYRVFAARYPGRCVGCGRWIRRKQPIVKLPAGYCHAVSTCVRKDSLVA